MDTDLRTAQRRDRVAWLRGRVRRGDRAPWACEGCHTPVGENTWPMHFTNTCPRCQGTGRAPFAGAIELAAYCGNPAALAALGDKVHWPGGFNGDQPRAATYTLEHWVNGLSRWPGALERAALAAVEAWWLAGHGQPTKGRQAIDAARDHITAPTAATRRALRPHMASVLHHTPTNLLALYAWNIGHGVHAEQWRRLIERCGDLTDEVVVRQAICDALIGWALA